MMRRGQLLMLLALGLAGCTSRVRQADAAVAPAVEAAVPTASLRLTPRCEPAGFDVELSLPLDGRPDFRLDDVVQGSPGMAALVTEASLIDASGAVPVQRAVTDGVLVVRPQRAVSGRVTLRYRAIADDGARFGVRNDAHGTGGVGAFFLLLPDSTRTYRLEVSLAAQTCGATPWRAFSSFGEGTATADGPLNALQSSAYFVGAPQVVDVEGAGVPFRAVWFGEPALDVRQASAWAGRVYAAERAFFADDDRAPYTMFERVLPSMGDRSNGTGQPHSFSSVLGPKTTFNPRLKFNIAHEMLHRWLGLRLRLAVPEGEGLWFTEGFTVYYALQLTRRAGLMSPDETLAELNQIVARHLGNPQRGASNAQIRERFFTDEVISVLPYTRGALYAAELDADLRAASKGSRSLDDVIRALASRGGEVAMTALRDAIDRELGADGVARLDSMLSGERQPRLDAPVFGPCFEPAPKSGWRRAAGVAESRCADR